MHTHLRLALAALAALALWAGEATAQEIERITPGRLQEVMPDADRFESAEGYPPVKRAYRGDELLGYVFVSSDLPPEEQGYSGPIQVLAGVTVDGELTEVRPISYRESYRYERGDFLSVPWFLAQFRGKAVSDRFALGVDVDGITGVTISARAMARTIRDAARRVALAYELPPAPAEPLSEAEVAALPWYELQRRGVAVTMSVRQRRRNPIEVSLVHVTSEELAQHLLGSRYEDLLEDVGEAGGADELLLYVVGNGGFVPSLREGWAVEQGGRTLALPEERVVNVGRPGGVLSGESPQAGALLLEEGDVDFSEPLTIAFDRGRPDLGVFRAEYTSRAAVARTVAAEPAREPDVPASPDEPDVAEAPAGTAPDATPADTGASPPPAGAPAPIDEETATVAADAGPTDATAAAAPTPADAAVSADNSVPADAALPPDAASLPDASTRDSASSSDPPSAPSSADAAPAEDVPTVAGEGALFGGLASTTWYRVGLVALVIALACLAFFTKATAPRWVSLAATLVLLGWIDGGFLSISHVTGLVWVGFSAVRSDPALLLLAGFTLATVLLWGRLFCGFLCPFGALQDFIDHFVPRRFKRELPPGVHRAAWKAKYAVLALILGAALVGVEVSLYQYFEPFGTVFFWSSNVLLWTIAAGFLVASAVIPRFYCRYACPLGALLAVGSLISLRRIRRVEQCDYCHVCEQKCPTGAITGPKIHFAECVRCNVCEVQLIERTGVCRHDMEEIRPRLVQIRRERVGAAE